jgi:myo-inositol-1(or 4)-monophosphatase
MPRATDLAPALLRRLLQTARSVVARHAPLLERRGGSPVRMIAKGPGDFVTRRDRDVERRVRRELARRHPEHGWIGEESGASAGGAEFLWVCDPIDGTSNFARGLPCFALALACLHRGDPVAAAMFCLPERMHYSAARGLGAWRGRRRLRIPRGRLGDAAILGVQWHRSTRSFDLLPALAGTGSRVRNLGCTVVHLCAVATGSLDANLQEQGRIWDIAAAGLLVVEAGGRFTDWTGRPLFPFADPASDRHHASLAAPPRVHERLVAELRRHRVVVAPP